MTYVYSELGSSVLPQPPTPSMYVCPLLISLPLVSRSINSARSVILLIFYFSTFILQISWIRPFNLTGTQGFNQAPALPTTDTINFLDRDIPPLGQRLQERYVNCV